MKLNMFKGKKKKAERTHEGARAVKLTDELRLRRTVLSCLLWENEFYEEGEIISARITSLAEKVAPETVAALAIEARSKMNLRHAPLLLLTVLAKTGAKKEKLVANTVTEVIQRADELSELGHLLAQRQDAALGPAQEGLGARVRQVRRLPAGEIRSPGPRTSA